MRQVSGLRYGENPHQPAAFYSDLSLAEVGRGGIAGSVQHHGKEVSLPTCLSAHDCAEALKPRPSLCY